MTDKFTPGPYEVDTDSGASYMVCRIESDVVVARHIKNAADAALFAAAPDLLAALELAAATVELHTPNGAQSQPAFPLTPAGDVDFVAVARMAREAIASAKRAAA